MRYVMKQKVFSWGDDFVIRDENENEMFLVKGSVFSFGDKLSFQDMNGNELAFIKQKVWAWGPTYEIYRNDALVATVTKELFTFFQCRFSVDVDGPDDYEASGDFMDHEYALTRVGAQVATVSKQWWSWTDTYGVDIADGQDDILLLASTVVIDMVCHDKHG